MDVSTYGKDFYVLNLIPEQHLKITVNKQGRRKFKLKRSIKKVLKQNGVKHYFLWGNNIPVQVVLRGASPQFISFLALL